MEYHYPAEFIVPTNISFDIGPIGRAFETEFEKAEIPLGLEHSHMLDGILLMGQLLIHSERIGFIVHLEVCDMGQRFNGCLSLN